jgi:hypothetical protein
MRFIAELLLQFLPLILAGAFDRYNIRTYIWVMVLGVSLISLGQMTHVDR